MCSHFSSVAHHTRIFHVHLYTHGHLCSREDLLRTRCHRVMLCGWMPRSRWSARSGAGRLQEEKSNPSYIWVLGGYLLPRNERDSAHGTAQLWGPREHRHEPWKRMSFGSEALSRQGSFPIMPRETGASKQLHPPTSDSEAVVWTYGLGVFSRVWVFPGRVLIRVGNVIPCSLLVSLPSVIPAPSYFFLCVHREGQMPGIRC